MTVASKITLVRIIFVPIFIALAVIEFPYHLLVSAIVYIVLGITDIIDGELARKTQTVSNLGKILDPIADKALSISGLLICCILKLFYFEVVTYVLVSIMIFREIAISVIRLVAKKKGTVFQADIFGKLKTIFTNIAIPTTLVVSSFTEINWFYTSFNWIATIVFYIAFILCVMSGINYCVVNRTKIKEAFSKTEIRQEDIDNQEDNND